MSHTQQLGKKGELIAASHLRRAGYKLLWENWRDGRNEVDLIALKGGTVVFVEVKTRAGAGDQLPDLQLSDRQKRRIYNAGMQFLRQNRLENPWRFDLIAIEWKGMGNYRLRHLTDLEFA